MSTAVVPPPTSFTFRSLQVSQITWALTDTTGVAITGATLAATCYQNRNLQNPVQYPGTAITGFTNISLPETATPGTYTAFLPATINPSPSTTGYITVITALMGSTPIGTWTIPTVFIPPQNVNDLVSLDQCKSWLQIDSTNTDDDGTIQFLISGFTQYVSNRTGISSFTQTQTYNEIYDGNGNTRLFVLNPPIVTLNSVTIGSSQAPISTDLVTPGVYVEQSKKSIAFRNGGGNYTGFITQWMFPFTFVKGMGNIQINYVGGYTSVPYDLAEAAMIAVGQNYRRKDWIDLASKALSSGAGVSGTTRYRDWALPPHVEKIIYYYSRYARS